MKEQMTSEPNLTPDPKKTVEIDRYEVVVKRQTSQLLLADWMQCALSSTENWSGLILVSWIEGRIPWGIGAKGTMTKTPMVGGPPVIATYWQPLRKLGELVSFWLKTPMCHSSLWTNSKRMSPGC